MKMNETQFHDFLDLEDFYYNNNIKTIYLDPEKTTYFIKYTKDEGTEFECQCVGVGSVEVPTFFICIHTQSEIGFAMFLKRINYHIEDAIAEEKSFRILNKLHKISKVINLVN